MKETKILIEKKSGKKYLIKELEQDFCTSEGVFLSKELKTKKTEIKSDKGKEAALLEANFVDLWEQLKRGPQIILQKDIGLIITKTGINKNSRVLDAGGGSGSLCGYLAHICKEVIAYEKEKNLIKVLEYNKKLLGLDNLKIKNKDIYLGIEEKNLDLVTLDLAEPWRAIKSVETALKAGGFLTVYLPNIIQVKMFVDGLRGSSLRLLEVEELIERRWKVEERVVRPEYEMLGHTGFLVFCRKY